MSMPECTAPMSDRATDREVSAALPGALLAALQAFEDFRTFPQIDLGGLVARRFISQFPSTATVAQIERALVANITRPRAEVARG